MTTDRPPPGSPWARHCPDAYPEAWFDALGLSALPPGFARFATDAEAALITGALTEAEFRSPAGRASAALSGPPPEPTRPVRGDRFGTLNGFIDLALRSLTRSEIAVWLVVFRDVKADTGTATVSQKSIAERADVTVRTVQTAIQSLVGRQLLTVVRRGRLGEGASVYRVKSVPRC